MIPGILWWLRRYSEPGEVQLRITPTQLPDRCVQKSQQQKQLVWANRLMLILKIVIIASGVKGGGGGAHGNVSERSQLTLSKRWGVFGTIENSSADGTSGS